MASINKAIIVGHLGNDPEVRYTPSNEAVTTISVATSSKYKDKATGETKVNTEWHRIVFFSRIAEIAGEYLQKGSLVYIEGKLRTRKWKDNEGVERYTTEIVADQMQMLGGNDENNKGAQPRNETRTTTKSQKKQQANRYEDIDDAIPF